MGERLVIRESDVETDLWSDPVRGEVGFRTIFGASVRPGDVTAGVTELPAGGWLGHHRHEPAELYFVLSGEGTLDIEGDSHAISAGTAAYIPGNSVHGIHNTGPGPLRIFFAFAVGSLEEIEYRFEAQP